MLFIRDLLLEMQTSEISVDSGILNSIFNYLEPTDVASFFSAMHLKHLPGDNSVLSRKELVSIVYSKDNEIMTTAKDAMLNDVKLLWTQSSSNIFRHFVSKCFLICHNYFPFLDELKPILLENYSQEWLLLFEFIRFTISTEVFNTPITPEMEEDISNLCVQYEAMNSSFGDHFIKSAILAFEENRNKLILESTTEINADERKKRDNITHMIYYAQLQQANLINDSMLFLILKDLVRTTNDESNYQFLNDYLSTFIS